MRFAAKSIVGCAAVVLIAGNIGCGGTPTAPAAQTPLDPNAPRVGASFGPASIEFIGANYPPGSTIGGCGPTITGCAGRLRMSFRVRSVAGGNVLRTAAWLHGANTVPCFAAIGPPFVFAANSTVTLDLVFDQVDTTCALPFESTDLGVNVEGSDGASGRQEYGIRYRFLQ